MRYVLTIASFIIISYIQFANADTIMLTPFDILLSPNDFDLEGPNHQILILNKNEVASIPITIKNHDSTQHEISLIIPALTNEIVKEYSFDPQLIIVPPNSEKQIKLNLTIKNDTDSQWGTINILAQSKSFGMTAKYFYVAIGDKDIEIDPFIDHSMRSGLPGAAFPYLYNDFRTPPPDLQNVLDGITANKFGVPRYLPSGYSFQGLTHVGSDLRYSPDFVYAPTKITNTTESIDFVRSGGLFVGYMFVNLNFNQTEWWPSYISQNEAQEIIVNGLRGAATQQQERVVAFDEIKYMFPAQIVLFDKYSEIYLSGNMPLEELLKVAASIPVPVTKDLPLVLSKVELWGPSSFVASSVKSCIDNTVGQLGPWAVGWIEIQNTEDKTITAQDITLRVGALHSTMPITLKANESCIFQTEDQITTRIGPGGSEGNGPPHGYDGSAVVFEYFVEENGKKIRYVDTTPEISDTFGDTRIWELVDGKWIYKESPMVKLKSLPPLELVISPLKQFKSGIPFDEIQCKESLQLIQKFDGSPACVKQETEEKLIQRKWAINLIPCLGMCGTIPFKINQTNLQ